ncbi:MAG: hypothetical protein LBG26_04230, partial [Treponema sp.]|nr:hypothetical protein [Treponema sp.]
MKNKVLFSLIVLLVFGFVFTGCNNGTTDDPYTPYIPYIPYTPGGETTVGNETISIDTLSIKTTGVKSLYVSGLSLQSSTDAKAVSGDTVIQTLSYINNLGQNTPFFFVSPSGKNIVLEVDGLEQLDEKRILVRLSSFYEIIADGNVYTIGESAFIYGRALIDMESGKVYDFSNYYAIKFADNGLLFAIESGTLYKIDLDNISSAVPLNNGAYTPIGEIDPPIVIGNKIIGCYYTSGTLNTHYIYDINNNVPRQLFSLSYLTSSMYSSLYEDMPITFFLGSAFFVDGHSYDAKNGLVIKDLEGSAWYFTMGRLGAPVQYDKLDNYFIGKITINENGEINLLNYSEGTISFDKYNYYSPKYFPLNNANIGRMPN